MIIKKGFTLIELIIAIAIIGIFASIMLVMLGDSRQKANRSKFKTYVSGIRTAITLACSGTSNSIVNINAMTADFTLDTSIAELKAGNSLNNYNCANDAGITFEPGSSLTGKVPASCASATARIRGADFSDCP